MMIDPDHNRLSIATEANWSLIDQAFMEMH